LKKLTFLLVAAIALGVAACGGGDQPTVASGQVPFDRAFIDAMVPHHQAAIEMAREAKEAGLSDPELQQRADHDELKELAGDIIAAQQRENEIIQSYFQGAHG
jgi:uncharacterized protein (DUF305 family)